MLKSLMSTSRRRWGFFLFQLIVIAADILSQQVRLENIFATNLGMNTTNAALINSTHALVLSDTKLYLSQYQVTALTPSILIPQAVDDQAYLFDIPQSNSNNSIYVVDSLGSIFTFHKQNGMLPVGSVKFTLKHPQLQVLLIRGIHEIPNRVYRYCLVHYLPEFALIDETAPSTIWRPASGPIRTATFSERLMILVPFDGGFLNIYQLQTLPNGQPTITDLIRTPGTSIGNIAEFTFLPQTDYFLAALHAHFVTADIVLFDANPTAPLMLQSLGSWSGLSSDMRHIKGTSSVILVSNYSLLVLNVANPNSRIEFAGLPGSQSWKYLEAQTAIYGVQAPFSLSSFILKGTACFEGCASCEMPGQPDSCFSCLPGYTLQDNRCILWQICEEDFLFNPDADKCEEKETAGRYIAGNGIMRTGLHEGCAEYFPLLPSRCKRCANPSFIAGSGLSCTSSVPTATSICPVQSFLDISIGSGFCSRCHENCATCSTSGNSSSCLTCNTGFKLTADGHCVTNCIEGYYTDLTELKGNILCRKCVVGCLECNNNHDSSCTKCVPGYFLVNGECRIRCARSFVPERSTGRCLFCTEENCSPCDPSEVLADGLCYSVCPNNTGTFNGRVCYPCHDIKCRLLRLSGGVVINAITGSPVDPNKLEEYDESIPRGWIWFLAALGFFILMFIIFVIAYSVYQKAGRFAKDKKPEVETAPALQPTTHFAWYQPDMWRVHQEEMQYMRNTLVQRPRKPKPEFRIQLYPVPATPVEEADPRMRLPFELAQNPRYPAYLNYRIPVHY